MAATDVDTKKILEPTSIDSSKDVDMQGKTPSSSSKKTRSKDKKKKPSTSSDEGAKENSDPASDLSQKEEKVKGKDKKKKPSSPTKQDNATMKRANEYAEVRADSDVSEEKVAKKEKKKKPTGSSSSEAKSTSNSSSDIVGYRDKIANLMSQVAGRLLEVDPLNPSLELLEILVWFCQGIACIDKPTGSSSDSDDEKTE